MWGVRNYGKLLEKHKKKSKKNDDQGMVVLDSVALSMLYVSNGGKRRIESKPQCRCNRNLLLNQTPQTPINLVVFFTCRSPLTCAENIEANPGNKEKRLLDD